MLECALTVDEALPLVCLGSLLSFLCGVGIGGNDLSANFAMVVGSGSLNMRQAIIYCTVFELLGAAFMGGRVSHTIRQGIANPELFTLNPNIVIVGMTAATLSAAMWLYLSTVFGLPVSITHCVVGSVLGFAVFSSGFDYVLMSGIEKIIVSWLLAPLVAVFVTAAIFYTLRRFVLRRRHSYERTKVILPYCMGVSLFVDVCFVFIERPSFLEDLLNRYPAGAVFAVFNVGVVALCVFANWFIFQTTFQEAVDAESFVWESEYIITAEAEEYPAKDKEESIGSSFGSHRRVSRIVVDSSRSTDGKLEESGSITVVPQISTRQRILERERLRNISQPDYGTQDTSSPFSPTPTLPEPDDTDVESEWNLKHKLRAIHYGPLAVKQFNPRAEYLFTVIQVVAGAMSSFVHGAVAGANATATFILLYETFTLTFLKNKKTALSASWSMVPAMFGIALGMFTLGNRLMKTVGVELVTVTPARGWCMQVGGTLVTMVLTGIGIPVSLSQCQVGAAIGCGLTDAGGRTEGVQWKVVLKIVTGWLVTIFIGACTTGLFLHVFSGLYCG
jgi:phosphate/sulfate permease